MNMALFFKNDAEKRLKELTGGLFLNKSFTKRLKKEGLTVNDGLEIQKEIKESIKRDEVKADGVETRINYLIEQKKKSKSELKSSHKDLSKSRKDNKSSSGIQIPDDAKEIEVISVNSLENMANDDKVKEMKFLLNQDHNLEECPKCSAKILKYDTFCYRCGADVRKALLDKSFEKSSQKSESTANAYGGFNPSVESNDLEQKFKESNSSSDELTELEQKYNESTSTIDELSELEKLYNKKVSSKYSPNFKFAYVLYLDQLNKNPNKEPKESIFKNYEIPFSKLKEQAEDDEFIGEGDPLIAARGAKVTDIRNVLKEHDLMVSGKKDDLIKRLGENLSDEELKEAFPNKVLSVTDKGLEFIEKNKYVFYYDKSSPIRSHMSVEEYDSIFDDVEDLSDENIYQLLIDYLLKREDDLANNNQWGLYRYNFMALGRVYKDSGDDFKLLDIDFKLFVAGINNFSDYSNQSEPAYAYIGKTYSNELINLLHSLSLSIDELKERFGQSYDDLKYPKLKISKEESLVYLLKLFSGEDIQDLTLEIRSKYPDPNLSYSY